MKNILVITLGKGRWDAKGNPTYQTAKYRFADGVESRSTRFVGLALFEWLQKRVSVDKIVVLGTGGSIWHSLCDDADTSFTTRLLESDFELFTSLEENCKEDRCDERLLARLSAALTEVVGKEFVCRYIPEGLAEKDQLQILQIINSVGEKGDTVYLDVTHGFRHLPMLEMLSAFLMKSSYTIGGVYYGAFESKNVDGTTPVICLSGLLHLQEWIEAMAVLRETGNVMPLARINSMQKFADELSRYQFYSQMNNVSQAKKIAIAICRKMDQLPPEGMLFRDKIREIFSWAEDSRYARRQFRQAWLAYEKGEYVRTVIMLMESVISANAERGQERIQNARDEIRERLNTTHEENWHVLRKLRNSFAHDGEVQRRGAATVIRMRGNVADFKKEIEKIFRWAEEQMPN